MVTLGNSVMLGAQFWPLLLVDLALSSSCSWISFGEWQSVT